MNITSISSSYSTYGTSSTTSNISSTSALLEAYHSAVVTSSNSNSSDSVSISSAGQSYLTQSTPPDFESMSIDDYRDHLLEMQSTLESYGYTSDLDISSLTDDELSELKDSMGTHGKGGQQGPPPPPPPSSSSTNASSTSDLMNSLLDALDSAEDESDIELLETFLDALEEQGYSSASTTSTYETIDEMLEIYSNLG